MLIDKEFSNFVKSRFFQSFSISGINKDINFNNQKTAMNFLKN